MADGIAAEATAVLRSAEAEQRRQGRMFCLDAAVKLFVDGKLSTLSADGKPGGFSSDDVVAIAKAFAEFIEGP